MRKNAVIIAYLLLFITSFVYAAMPLSSFIIQPDNFNKDVYNQKESQFSITSPDSNCSLLRTSNQKVLSESIKRPGKEIIIATGDYRLKEPIDNKKYLKKTPYLDIENNEIRKAASKFQKSKDPVNDISFFVYQHISDKKEGIPLIPASSILKDRAGDCTEHSILTVALLRACNIPARAVVGVILTENFNGKNDIFVYHMWTEVYRNGNWELLDSTRPGQIHHNRYIAFAFHNLTTEAPLDYLDAISAIYNVRIKQVN